MDTVVAPEKAVRWGGTKAGILLAFVLAAGCRTSPERPRPVADVASVSVVRLRQSVDRNPTDVGAMRELGRALLPTSRPEAARWLRKAFETDPKDSVWRDLADLFASAGYLDREIETCEAHLRAAPGDAAAMGRLATLLLIVADQEGAIRLADKAAIAAPTDPDVLKAVSQVHYSTLKFRKAVEAYAPLVSVRSVDPEDWNRYSELLRADGRYEEADSAIAKAIALAPDKPNYHAQRAHVLATVEPTGRFAEAEAEARKAIERGDRSVDNRYWLAVAIQGQGRTDDAVKAFEDVARDDLSYEKTAFHLGRLYRRNPDTAARGVELLKAYDTMSRNEREVAFARRTLRLHPEALANHYKLAQYYLRAEEYPTAIALLRRAMARFPSNKAVRTTLASALEASGRLTEAGELAKAGTTR
ncbi:MAG: tetratricopeptide repeat protein [Armatimonadota bacterium]